MVERNIPLTVFEERVLQRYLFFVLHSEEVADQKAKRQMANLENYPSNINLIIPEVEYYNKIETRPGKKPPKKVIEYPKSGHKTKVYKPDFVVYPKIEAQRMGPLSGEGIFIEVKWNYWKNFEDHQWLALFYNGNSIVASLDEPSESEWEEALKKKSEELRSKYPALDKEEWLTKPENNIQHYHIDSNHFKNWAVRNIGMLVNSQLKVGRKRYWLMVLSGSMLKNWDRMLRRNIANKNTINKKPFWAWKNEGDNLTQLMKMSDGDEILFIDAKSPHPRYGKGRWGNNIDRKTASDKELEKAPFDVKSMYHLRIVSHSSRSAYHCHLGDDEYSNFFENCTAGCEIFGCNGCGKGVKRSMNNVIWPHFVKMRLLGGVHEPSDYKTLLRGKLGRRLGECASSPYTPAELTEEEFTGLMGQILGDD